MNPATVEIVEYIAKHFGPCDPGFARKVQDHMAVMQESNSSECSRLEFNRAIRTAHEPVNSGWQLLPASSS